MQIHILRHGIAEVAAAGTPDSGRALVPEGRKKLRAVLGVAREVGVSPEAILTSPYVRAVQTAEIAAEELRFSGELIQLDALKPGGSPREAWEEIRIHAGLQSVLITGHEPLLSSLGAFLLGAPSLLIDLKKGSMLRIDMDRTGPEPRGVLRWYYIPKIAMAGANS